MASGQSVSPLQVDSWGDGMRHRTHSPRQEYRHEFRPHRLRRARRVVLQRRVGTRSRDQGHLSAATADAASNAHARRRSARHGLPGHRLHGRSHPRDDAPKGAGRILASCAGATQSFRSTHRRKGSNSAPPPPASGYQVRSRGVSWEPEAGHPARRKARNSPPRTRGRRPAGPIRGRR